MDMITNGFSHFCTKISRCGSGFSFTVLLILLMMEGCNQEIEYNLLTGDVIGIVYNDGFISSDPTIVILEGQGYTKTTGTDSQGMFSFAGLTTGTYNFTYTKKGYGTCYLNGYAFIGGNTKSIELTAIDMPVLPDALISDLSAELVTDNTGGRIRKRIFWSAAISPDISMETNYICYLGCDAEVSCHDYETYHHFAIYEDFIELTYYEINLFRNYKTLHMILYPYHTLGSKYTDMETGCIVFSGIQQEGASNIVSLTDK